MASACRSRNAWFASFLVVALCCTAWPLSLRTTSLPNDMHEAEIMLREGSLDSTEWQLLQPYYIQPINVPQGELALLNDAFDPCVRTLPVSQEQLSRYFPWDKAAQDRFFTDYPELVKYKPILSFSKPDSRRMSGAGLALSVNDRLVTQTTSRFSLQPGWGIAVAGSIGHGDTADLWIKRGASIAVPDVASLCAGNFTMGADNGLFYGYFPGGAGPVTTFSNWKYAGSRAWNGLLARSDRWSNARFTAFYHERFTEKAFGVFCDAGPSCALLFNVGVSRLAPGASDSARPLDTYFFHYGFSGAARGFEYSLNAGSPRIDPKAIPLTAQCSRKKDGSGFSVLFARLPEGLALSRSKIAFDCQSELDESGGTPASDITLADCRTSLALSRLFVTAFSVSYVTAADRSALTAVAEAAGKGVVDYKASYSYHMSTAASVETHRAALSVERELSKSIRPSLLCDCYLTSSGFGSMRGRLPVAITCPAACFLRRMPPCTRIPRRSGRIRWGSWKNFNYRTPRGVIAMRQRPLIRPLPRSGTSMRERISVFSCAAACALAWLSCGVQGPSRTGSGLRFAVVNAGGGLSQMASSGAEAVVFDMGDTGAAQSWKDAYLAAGAPRIRTIVISNSRSAHCGGLSMLPDSTDFSGDIVTSVCEDTALVRAMCGWWASRVRFRTIGAGDTVAGPGGSFALCVWPPRSIALQAPVSGNVKEEYSLCFLLRYQSNTVLVTSDIDTSAQQALSARLGSGLGADMLVLPRNGSAGSIDPVFCGYVAPSIGVISCGEGNNDGASAPAVLALLFQMHVRLYQTCSRGTFAAFSNGYYWTVSAENSP